MAGFGNFNQNDFQRIFYFKYLSNVSPEETVISLHEEINHRLYAARHFQLVIEPVELLRRRSERTGNTGETSRRQHIVISPDTDNSGSNENVVVPRDNILLRRVKFLYQIFARRELQVYFLPGNRNIESVVLLHNVWEILEINRTLPLERRESIFLQVNSLKVIIGPGEIAIHFWNSTEPRVIERIRYVHDDGKTVIHYTNERHHIPQKKYQTLAAKDFDFLVRNPRTQWVSWQFDIAPHGGQYPYSAFFGKIENYFRKFFREYSHVVNFRGIHVVNLQMKIFENRQDPRTKNQGLIMKVLPFLNENTLNKIQLNVFSDTSDVKLNSHALRNCAQWRACQVLDITDKRIFINDFRLIARIPSVKMTWQRRGYRDLFTKLSRNIRRGHEVACTFPSLGNREAQRLKREEIDREIDQCIRDGIFHSDEIITVFGTSGRPRYFLDDQDMTMEYRKRGNR